MKFAYEMSITEHPTTKEQARTSLLSALQLVKEGGPIGEHSYLCVRLERIERGGLITAELSISLKAYITAQIDSSETFKIWLVANGPYDNTYEYSSGMIALSRAAWLDKMIEELSDEKA